MLIAAVVGIGYYGFGPGAGRPISTPISTPISIQTATPISTPISIQTATAPPATFHDTVPQRGQVVFSGDRPLEAGTCEVYNQVKWVEWYDAVSATYIFKFRPGGDPVYLSITKNGAPFLGPTALPTTETQGFDCFSDTSHVTGTYPTSIGNFHFSLTYDGSVIAEGDLSVG